MIKQFFKEITNEELLQKIWKTAKEKFTGRVMAIAACMGYMAGFIFHESIPMDIFVMVLYIYLVYTMWQKVKKVIIEEEKEEGKKNE
jgi:uncharacterized membrane protein YfcA